MKEQRYISNKRLWTEKGKRVSVFCREIRKGIMEIFILECSKLDEFDRQYANNLYEQYLKGGKEWLKLGVCHPKIEEIGIPEDGTIQYTFKEYCNNSFYKKQTAVMQLLGCQVISCKKKKGTYELEILKKIQ